MKTFIGLILFLATTVFGVLTFAITPSWASPDVPINFSPTVINAIQMTHLSSSPNRTISVFYASGSAATWATNGGVPLIRSLKAGPITVSVNPDGSALIPQITVPRKGFGEVMNYIVIIVHSANQNESNILNPSGTVPTAIGPVDLTGFDQSSFDNDRVIYLPMMLTSDRTGITQINGTPVNGLQQIMIDAGKLP